MQQVQVVGTATPFELMTLKQLSESSEERVSWLVDGMLPNGSLTILAGKPKSGKSTISRQLAVAVAQGQDFLSRPTTQGGVLYFAIEEKSAEVAVHLEMLCAKHDDPIFVQCGAIPHGDPIKRLEATLKKRADVRLVIIDPIFRFIGGVHDANDYLQVTVALAPLLEMSRRYNVHILIVHHMKKKETDDQMDGILGSTALAASVDTLVALKTDAAGNRILCTRQRYGIDMKPTQLHWNASEKALSLGLTTEALADQRSDSTSARIREEMLMYIAAKTQAPQQEIFDNVTGKLQSKKNCLRSLVDDGCLAEAGTGRRGDPFFYSLRSEALNVLEPPLSSTPTGAVQSSPAKCSEAV